MYKFTFRTENALVTPRWSKGKQVKESCIFVLARTQGEANFKHSQYFDYGVKMGFYRANRS